MVFRIYAMKIRSHTTEKSWIVYLITNKVNGKVYVGQTSCGLKRRWALHCSHSAGNKHLLNSIRKYGRDSFEISIIHGPGLTFEESSTLEKREISKRKSTDHQFGYNRSTGGEGGANGMRFPSETYPKRLGRKCSVETIKKLRDAAIGRKCSPETRVKLRLALKGKKPSAKAIENSRNVWIGRKHSPESKRKIGAAQREVREVKPRTPETITKLKAAWKRRKLKNPEMVFPFQKEK